MIMYKSVSLKRIMHYKHYNINIIMIHIQNDCSIAQNLRKICDKNNVRPRKIAAEIGVADVTVTRWKNGSTPNRDTLENCKKFDVCRVSYGQR